MAIYSEFSLSLDAVAPAPSPGTDGNGVDHGAVHSNFLGYATVSGGSSDLAYVSYEGSVDGVNWYTEAQPYAMAGGKVSTFQLSVPARYIRATAYTSSGSPVVTASVAVES